jgi:hypothetical protein
VVRIGIHRSKKQACGEALSCSSAVARSQTSLRTELRATTAPTMPNVVESMLDYTLWCFPYASPALTFGAGKRQTAPKDHSKSLTCLRKIGAGEGIRTLDPDLGKFGTTRQQPNGSPPWEFSGSPARHITPENAVLNLSLER